MKIDDVRELAYWSILNNYFWRKSQEALQVIKNVDSISKLFENGFLKSKEYSKLSEEAKIIFKQYIGKDIDMYEREAASSIKQNINLIPYSDERYPTLLHDVPNPPLLLYHKGPLLDFTNCIALVGRRNLSSYGHIKAREIARKLAKENYTVVSGLARGVDTEAHVGALQEDGKTIAVLPTNFNEIYPNENINLLLDITVKGAAITMTPPHVSLVKSRFVHRNRIISGMSKAVIIAETDGFGGSARQIEFSEGQNRPTFILKPKGNAEAVEGYEKYMKQGLISFTEPEELIEMIKNKKISHQKILE
jgi:DNA processing protein